MSHEPFIERRADPTFLGLFEKQKSIIIGIIAATAGFFWLVVIPINDIRVQLASVQEKLNTAALQIEKQLASARDLEKRVDKLEVSVDQLTRKK